LASVENKQVDSLLAWLRSASGDPQAPGTLGAVVSRAGLGKTTFLTQLSIDCLLEGHNVIHIALGQTIERVQAHYDTLLAVRISDLSRKEQESLLVEISRRRAIQVFAERALDHERIERVLTTFRRHLNLLPRMVVIDGARPKEALEAAELLKKIAREHDCQIWIAETITDVQKGKIGRTSPGGDGSGGEIDLLVSLEPADNAVRARLLERTSSRGMQAVDLLLDAENLFPVAAAPSDRSDPRRHILFSGAARGTEDTFGTFAQKWGVTERNFTFDGHDPARKNGLVVLQPEELEMGNVSWSYFKAHVKRDFDENERFKKVVQSIWHLVNPAGEVFFVGNLLPGGAVKGGTGWAVELAKHLGKPVWLFDQERLCWYEWFEHDWRACDPPNISHYRFCGTGTRSLTAAGKRAIGELFERSFGPPPSDNGA